MNNEKKEITMLCQESRIVTKKQLREWINVEKKQYGSGGIIRTLLPISEMDVLRKHQVILRKTEYYTNTNCKVLSTFYRIRLMRIQNKYALHIPINTCAKGLHVMHVGPILINGNASVGENCAIHINTALVAGGNSNGAPVINNNVVIGVGAVVVGNVHIANNVAIGANAVVTKDITETDIAVAGVPAKKVSNNGRSKWNKRV